MTYYRSRLVGDDSWMDQAACAPPEKDKATLTSVFFSADPMDQHAAKAICAQCPVREACLEWALANGEWDGIWGGMEGPDLHRLHRRRQRAARLSA
jgi:WhiB family redox-sensing transcriptional regulator